MACNNYVSTKRGEVLLKFMDKPHVQFIDIEKSYDGKTLVVEKLNLDIFAGEFLTILGPSGSGKSTCLSMLAGFETATSGEVKLKGKSINYIAPHNRNFGMVFQNYALFPHMTVFENLMFPLKIRKLPMVDARKKVQRALEMVWMSEYINRWPSQLSGGQQQRIAVARALVFNPSLILMDEPLGALDKQLREQMQYEIKQIHKELGVTIVYVTHDQSEAMTMSNRVAILNNGVIQQLATPDQLYESPMNAFVAEFFGANNRLIGKVIEDNGDTCKAELKDGSQIQAVAVNINKAGTRTTLAIRPERVFIRPEHKNGCPNIFKAKIQKLTYLGDHIRIHTAFCENEDFIIKVSNTQQGFNLRPGETLEIGWKVEDCRALDPYCSDNVCPI